MPLYIVAGILIVVGVVLFVEGLRRGRLRRRIAETPTTPIRHLVQGQFAEIVGRVSCAQPLRTPDGDVPCVYYRYELERLSGSSGGSQPHWERMDRREKRTAFTLTDASGSIGVDPAGARIDAPMIVERFVTPGELLPFGAENIARVPKGFEKLVLDGLSTLAEKLGGEGAGKAGNQRVRVTALPVDQDAYVLSTAERTADGLLRAGKGPNPFFISTKSEAELLDGLGRTSRIMSVVGPILVVVGAAGVAAAWVWL